MSNKKTILSYGEILWDLLPSGAKLGGAPFNFAYRANSLGDNGYIISRLGRDEHGQKAWDHAVSLGMDTRLIQWDEQKPTGTVHVTLDEKNNPDYYIVPDVAYDNIEMTDDLLEFKSSADCICYGTLIQRTERSRTTLKELLKNTENQLKLLDINLRKECYTPETIRESLDIADILKLNEDEAYFLSGMFHFTDKSIPSIAQGLIEKWSLTHCLISFGEKGAFAASKEQQVYVPGYKVEVDDPCGSGDAFAAAFIHHFLRGEPLDECCNYGNALGAMVATQSGATEPISPEEIDAFILSKHERLIEPSLETFMTT